jgi:pimeloyl-ACP methyl ester carboxylesterase
MQVIVNDLLVHYDKYGKGKTIVLLHGWADSSRGLQALSQALAQHYQVITIDLPGFGGSQAPAKPWGLDNYAHCIQVTLDKLGISDLRAVIGHSNGGAIAIRGVARGWLVPDRLVLIAAAGVRGTQPGRKQLLKLIAKTGKLVTSPLPATVQKRLRRSLYKGVGSDMLVAEHMQETFKAVVADDVRSDAPAIQQPTLLLYGENDKQTPPWYGETYHQLITGSTLEILPGAGHFVHQDRPAEVMKAIEEFLA